MKLENIMELVQNKTKLCKVLEINRSTLYTWKNSEIPEKYRSKIEDFLAAENDINYLEKYGKTLILKGLRILPIPRGEKYPSGVSNWQNLRLDKKKLDSYLKDPTHDYQSIGVLTGKIVAVDLDLYDKHIVNLMREFCFSKLGKTIERVGKSPKTMLIYRVEEEVAKIQSSVWVDNLFNEVKVEILGKGQQFVAYGIHPDTKKPYHWVNDVSIKDVDLKDLPIVSLDQLRSVVEHFDTVKPTYWELKKKNSTNVKVKKGKSEEDFLLNFKNPRDVSKKQIQDALAQLEADDYDFWVQMGMALYHQYKGEDEGFKLWDDWSTKSAKYSDSKENITKWKSFAANYNSTNPITIGSLLYAVKKGTNLKDKFAWKNDFQRTKDWSIKLSAFNLNLILSNDPAIVKDVYLDQYKAEIVIGNDVMRDEDAILIRSKISKDYQLEFSKNSVFDALTELAHNNKRHFLKEYLEDLEWDGRPRVEKMWVDYLGEKDSTYARETAKMFFINAVKRVYRPGCKFDYMPFITGPQGVGKSTFFSTLAVRPEWFTDNVSMNDPKAAVEGIQGVWFVEFAELQGFKKVDVDHIKAFTSRVDDRMRKAYGRIPEKLPRSCVFTGTGNDAQSLSDETGNRRFWPLEVNTPIPLGDLKKNIDMIWAEAYQLFLKEPNFFFSAEAQSQAELIQEENSIDDGLKGLVEEYLEKEHTDFETGEPYFINKVCVRELIDHVLKPSELRNTKAISQRLNNIMRNVEGWENKSKRMRFTGYGVQRGFCRIKV